MILHRIVYAEDWQRVPHEAMLPSKLSCAPVGEYIEASEHFNDFTAAVNVLSSIQKRNEKEININRPAKELKYSASHHTSTHGAY